MKLNLEIDTGLLKKAMKETRLQSTDAVIELGLKTLVRLANQDSKRAEELSSMSEKSNKTD